MEHNMLSTFILATSMKKYNKFFCTIVMPISLFASPKQTWNAIAKKKKKKTLMIKYPKVAGDDLVLKNSSGGISIRSSRVL